MDRAHRTNNIDAIRIVLAFLVLFSHCYPLATGSERGEPLKQFTNGQLTLGSLAVDFFFILSGYLITQSWLRSRDAGAFLRKRVVRIYPGIVVASLLCLFVVIPLASPAYSAVFTRRRLLEESWRILALRPDLTTPLAFVSNPARYTVNGSLWTISYEFWCYIGVMILGMTTLLARRGVMVALFAASVVVHFAFERYDLRPGGKMLGVIFGYPPFWARLLPMFLSGMVAHHYRDRLRPHRGAALACLAGLAIAARIPHAMVFAVPTLGTYLLFYLAYTTEFAWHNAARFGDFSYGIYLYAFPIQQLIMMAIGHPTSPFLLFALSAPATLMAGVLSWHLVESPFLRMARTRPVPVASPELVGAV